MPLAQRVAGFGRSSDIAGAGTGSLVGTAKSSADRLHGPPLRAFSPATAAADTLPRIASLSRTATDLRPYWNWYLIALPNPNPQH